MIQAGFLIVILVAGAIFDNIKKKKVLASANFNDVKETKEDSSNA